MPLLLGSHVELADPFTGAAHRGAHVIQVNLAAPQTWRTPTPRRDPQAWKDWGPVYVHAPYLINPASIRPELREKSRTCLREHAEAAAAIGAAGLVVHGGHPTGTGTLHDAITGWVEVLDGWDSPVPILIENTAGGHAGPARHLAGLAELWPALTGIGANIGYCLDTCHAWAGGQDLHGLVEATLAITGRIDLVHANDSRDPAGSGRDRHANLGDGQIPADLLLAVIRDAGTATVVETPGGPDAMAADLAWLRDRL